MYSTAPMFSLKLEMPMIVTLFISPEICSLNRHCCHVPIYLRLLYRVKYVCVCLLARVWQHYERYKEAEIFLIGSHYRAIFRSVYSKVSSGKP